MAHSDEVHDDDQVSGNQGEQEASVRRSRGGRIYNAKGELVAIVDPPDPPVPFHIGMDGKVCCCNLQRDHLGEPGLGVIKRCYDPLA